MDSIAAERIRSAAVKAFAESGYGGTSTRQIANRLNMSPAAMYPHYRSKEALLFAISQQGHCELLSALREVDDPGKTIGCRLSNVVRAFTVWQAENHELARVVQYELNGLTPAHYRTVIAIRRDTTKVIADIIHAGAESGEFDVDCAADVVLAISSLCVDVCRWFPTREQRDPKRLGTAYAGIVQRLVGAAS